MSRAQMHSGWLLSLAIVAFVGPTIQYMNIVFTATSRWVVLAVVIIVLLFRGRLHRALISRVGLLLACYLSWCLATVTWSEAPSLSLAKCAALFAVSVGMVAAGRAWVERVGIPGALGYLGPVALVSALTGVLGLGSETATVVTGVYDLYQGLSGNPNMLGAMVMMSSAYIFWKLFTTWGRGRERWIWVTFLALMTMLLGLSHARSSILGFLCISLAFGLALPRGLRIRAVALIALGALVVAVLKPSLLDQATYHYVYKGTGDESVFYTRERVWEESLDLAADGGFFGAGYGVTIGGGAFEGGLTAVGYGREKGNTQLAIWEETGLVGLAFYAIFLAALFGELARGLRHAAERVDVMVLALLVGGLVGMTAMSIFEAWWVAPGSPEAVWFWGTTGVALGVAQQIRWKARWRQGVVRDSPHWAQVDRRVMGGGFQR